MFNTKTTLEKLQQQSQDALGAFQTIITNLTKSNQELAKEKETRISKVQELEAELETINGLEISNSKVINKINKFLSDED